MKSKDICVRAGVCDEEQGYLFKATKKWLCSEAAIALTMGEIFLTGDCPFVQKFGSECVKKAPNTGGIRRFCSA